MSPATAPIRKLLIIDSQVNNWQSLARAASSDTEVLILDSSSDGLTQISDYLTTMSANAGAEEFVPLQSIHIISHGSAGSLFLGSSTVTESNLSFYSKQLAILGNALSEDGDILLYGCNVAEDKAGLGFINQFAALTNADVAASNDKTGSAMLGGDWLLEVTSGTIESPLALSKATMNSFTNILATNTAPIFAVNNGVKFTIVTTDVGYLSNTGCSVTTQADGKILVAGFVSVFNGDYSHADFIIVRYNNDLSLDTSFNSDGILTTDFDFASDAGQFVTVQANGKILVAGGSYNSNNGSFALARYNSNGSLDTSFDGDGKVTTSFGTSDAMGYSISVQANGKILVAGRSGTNSAGDFALVRYNSNGSLDTSFDGDGKVTTDFGTNNYNTGHSVTIQTNGKILVAGSTSGGNNSYYALARYNTDGSLDTSFGGDGKVITNVGSPSSNFGYYSNSGAAVTLQADGKILVVGSSYDEGKAKFALARYNTNGSLDTSFDDDGKVITFVGDGDRGCSVIVQDDGKILVAGSSYYDNESKTVFALLRYNSDGSMDTSFDSDGIVTTAIGTSFGSYDVGYSVTVQADDKILVAGVSNNKFAIVRYNPNGSLDSTFEPPVNTLNGISNYTENSVPVVLDNTVQIYDAELANQGNYNGATVTLARHVGANSQDKFSGSGSLTFSGITALLSGFPIGTFSNSNGKLTITFNSYASQTLVNEALSSIAYSNTSNNPPVSVQIDWTFNDGNTGTQGTGGALTVLGSTTVNITPTNDAPVPTAPTAINFVDTVLDDSYATVTGSFVATDIDSSSLTYGITGGTDNGNGTISKTSTYGILTMTKATGSYSFLANDAAIEPLTVAASISFAVTVSDGSLTRSKTLTINIAQNGATESIGNDTLTGTSGNDKFDGLAGNDIINGLAGADIMKGGPGNDIYVVDNPGDVVTETSTLPTEIDRVNSSISYILKANVENLTLTGTAAINGTGNALNNTLTGNSAANVLKGGTGNDIYVIGVSDTVTETSTLSTEIDKVNSSVSYTLTANVENLTLTGTASINGTGNTLNNVLTGNTSANTLKGSAGNDIVIGGLGKDNLTGGLDADKFKFNAVAETGITATTRDIITDFKHSQGDKIDLSAIDANTALASNNAFSAPTVGGSYSGVFVAPGKLYFDQTAHILYGNNDADTSADFSIQLTGVNTLVAADLVL